MYDVVCDLKKTFGYKNLRELKDPSAMAALAKILGCGSDDLRAEIFQLLDSREQISKQMKVILTAVTCFLNKDSITL